jgi:hypothetical protein
MKRKFIAAIALAGSLACSPWAAGADSFPKSGADRPLPETGTLNGIDLDKQFIIVGDTVFQLSPYTQVRTSDGSTMSIDGLKVGTTIKFDTSGQKQSGHYVITEIQVTAK